MAQASLRPLSISHRMQRDSRMARFGVNFANRHQLNDLITLASVDMTITSHDIMCKAACICRWNSNNIALINGYI